MRKLIRYDFAILIAAMMIRCASQNTLIKGDTVVMMEIKLDLSTNMEIVRIDQTSEFYDLDQSRLNIVFTNRGRKSLAFPGEAIMRRVIRSYQNTLTKARQEFNQNEPPVGASDLTHIAPGESWRYAIGIELPDKLLARDVKATSVKVCVVWDKSELDRALFPDGSYNWAESFSACADVVMRR